MSSANKRRGTLFESASEEYAIASGLRAKRLPRAGANDIGDMSIELKSGTVLVCELKDWAKPAWPEFFRQAHVEAERYEARYRVPTVPVVMVKSRRQGVNRNLVVFYAEDFYDLLHREGLA